MDMLSHALWADIGRRTVSGKSSEQARFTPLAVPMQSAQDGHSGHSH
jgi:hypothetical protein